MLEKIALLAMPGLTPFEFGVICEVFGIDRRSTGGPVFDFTIATAVPGPVRTSMGFDVVIDNDLSTIAEADLLAVPAYPVGTPVDEVYLEAIQAAHARGAWVMSVCSGAFVLAQSGILDGRRATTHWMYADKLAERFPRIEVDADRLFVEQDRIVTGAGTAAGIDAALHIVRREMGAGVANAIARRMVVPPQRDGGQSQFIATPVVECADDSLAEVLDWMAEHLERDLPVPELARKALMSPRTFARRFKSETGTTPAAWLNRQRLLRAQQLLEESDYGLERIAVETGFGTAAVLRHHFVRVLQTTPTAYRATFGTLAAAAGSRSDAPDAALTG